MGRRWQFGEKRSLARLIGAMALVVATVLVLVPARPTSANAVEASVGAAASTSTPTGGLPTILSPQISLNPQAVLEIDEGDVVCGAGYVKINGQITPNLEGLTSAIGLLNVPNNWTVRSSWEVTTSGAGSQTLSLGFVDTPVVNPAGTSLMSAPYVDDVRFAALVNGPAPTVFTYTVTVQLLNGQQWQNGNKVTVGCGNAVTVTETSLNAEVIPASPSPVQTPPAPEAIDWGLCDDPAALSNEQCATIQVPLDHFNSRGIVIELALNRFAATGVSKGPMVTNPGGPGGSGLGFARGMASIYKGTSLTEDYDIIGMDPRGVAQSSPAPFCLPAQFPQAGLDNVLDPDWTAFFNAAVPATAAANSVCSVAGARYLEFLGTRQVAADIDWIRRAENVTRGGTPLDMHYWGGSYGTRLGEVYLQQFGNHAGQVLLSGAVDPASTFVDFSVDRTGPPDQVAQQLFFPAAPPETEDQFFEVVQALTPANGQMAMDVSVTAVVDAQTVDVTLNTFLATVSASLRSEASWTETVDYIADTWANVVDGQSVQILSPSSPEYGEPIPEIAGGDGRTTGDQWRRLVANASSPEALRIALNGEVIRNVVNCIDLPGIQTSSAQMASAASAAVSGSPVNYLGWMYLDGLKDCAGYALPLSDGSAGKVWPALAFPAGTPAPLVIGSVGDTATPFAWSEDLVDFFISVGIPAVLLTYEGAEHVAGFSWPPSRCMYGAINDLFAGDGLPAPNTVCPFISTLNRQPPVGVTAEAGVGQVVLTWTPSQQRLGGTVDGFVVEQRRSPDGEWELVEQSGGSCDTIADKPDATSCVIGGLSNGVVYQFRMTTLPRYAPTALYSDPSNEATPSEPAVPTFTG